MTLDFWRALGVWTGTAIAYWVVTYLVDPSLTLATFEQNLTMLVASAIILWVFSWAYFLTPTIKASTRHGLELAAFMIVANIVLGFISAIIIPIQQELPSFGMALDLFLWVAAFVIGIGVPTLTGWWLANKKN